MPVVDVKGLSWVGWFVDRGKRGSGSEDKEGGVRYEVRCKRVWCTEVVNMFLLMGREKEREDGSA